LPRSHGRLATRLRRFERLDWCRTTWVKGGIDDSNRELAFVDLGADPEASSDPEGIVNAKAEYETVWQSLNGRPFGGEFPARSHAEWLSLGQLFHELFTFEVSATEVKSYKQQMFSPSRILREVVHLKDPGARAWSFILTFKVSP
jgi:hypothetical protein